MANSDYQYEQIVRGIPATACYKKENDGKGPAVTGVATMQTYLKNIGYKITDTSGCFGASTEAAVKAFQTESSLNNDGSAGNATIGKLESARTSTYFTKYGYPLESAQWGRDNILAGKFENVDLLARIIYGEHTYSASDQKGVAIVIRNREKSNDSAYIAPSSSYPAASSWARVVGRSGAYGTAAASYTESRVPARGGAGWKTAVDYAKQLVNRDTSLAIKGYVVNGKTVTDKTEDVLAQMNQITGTDYIDYYNAGTKFKGTTICVGKDLTKYNVLCTY